jgi:hypothetical protein
MNIFVIPKHLIINENIRYYDGINSGSPHPPLNLRLLVLLRCLLFLVVFLERLVRLFLDLPKMDVKANHFIIYYSDILICSISLLSSAVILSVILSVGINSMGIISLGLGSTGFCSLEIASILIFFATFRFMF